MVTPVKKVPIHLQSAANRLLIKGASIVNHDGIEQADVYVEDTKIKQVRQAYFFTVFLATTETGISDNLSLEKKS